MIKVTRTTMISLTRNTLNIMEPKGVVVRVDRISPHKGADKLEIGELSTKNRVVLPKGSHSEGDMLVFISSGTVIPESVTEGTPHHKVLKGSNFIVSSVKIRGELSEGITFSLDILGDYKKIVKEGTDISDILNLTTKQQQFEAKKQNKAMSLTKKKATHVITFTSCTELSGGYLKIVFNWQEGTQQVVMKLGDPSILSTKRFLFIPPGCLVDPVLFHNDIVAQKVLSSNNGISAPFWINDTLSEGLALPCGVTVSRVSKCSSAEIMESKRSYQPIKTSIKSVYAIDESSSVISLYGTSKVVVQKNCQFNSGEEVVFFPAGMTIPRLLSEQLNIKSEDRVVRLSVHHNEYVSQGLLISVSHIQSHIDISSINELEDMSQLFNYSSLYPLAMITTVAAINNHPNDTTAEVVIVTPLDSTDHILVVTMSGLYKLGDKCVFISPPGMIPSNLSGESDPVKVEAKVIKGVPSAGRLFQMCDVAERMPHLSEQLKSCLPGDSVTEILGITEEIRKLASVVIISELSTHPKRDNLVIVNQNGWSTVLFDKELKIGDKVIYYEIDSVIPEDILNQFPPENYFGSSLASRAKNAVRSTKVAGVLSQGILLPIPNNLKESTLSEGDDVTLRLGIGKYDPCQEAVNSGSTGQIGRFPHGVSKTEAPRIQTLSLDKHKKVQFYITEKLDGSSITCVMRDGDFSVASRNWTVSEDTLHGSAADKLGVESALRKANIDNIAIQGELIGPKISGNRYNLKDVTIKFFSVYNIAKVEYFPLEDAVNLIEAIGLSWVPFYSKSYFISPEDTKESILLMADGKSILNPLVDREGLVFRSTDSVVKDDQFYSKISFKVISNSYLLRFEGMSDDKKSKKKKEKKQKTN